MGSRLRAILIILAVFAVLGYGFYSLAHNPEWQSFDWHRLFDAIRQINIGEMAGAILLMYMTYYIRAWRWYEFVRPVKRADIRNLLTAQILGFGAVAVLGRPGDLVRPYLVARKEG